MNASSILPEEVWADVLGKVKNPGDVYAVAKACTTFENLLERRRNTVTSALVLPILLSHRNRDLIKGRICRLVCYDWKVTVDSYRQSLDYHLNFDNNSGFALYQLGIRKPVIRFSKSGSASYMRRTFGEVLASARCNNPFICRRISVEESYCYCDPNPVINYWDGIEDILEPFGGCIWHCTIRIYRSLPTSEVSKPLIYIYKEILHRCLSRMPNLQTLRFDFIVKGNNPLPGEQTDELMSAIKRDPIPNLQLFKLKLDNVPAFLAEEVLRATQPLALKHLELNKFEGDVKKIVEKFNALEDFRIGFTPAKVLVKDLRWTRWPLERLEFEVDFAEMPSGSSTEKIRKLFAMLNEFGETLIALQMVLKGPINYFGIGRQKDLKLALPCLQALRMLLWNDDLTWESLNFVMELKKLKSLQVHGDKPPSYYASKTVTKSKEWDAIQKSWIQSNITEPNIWEVLPRLTDLEFSGRNQVNFSLERDNDRIHSIDRWTAVKRCYNYKDSHLKEVITWHIFPGGGKKYVDASM